MRGQTSRRRSTTQRGRKTRGSQQDLVESSRLKSNVGNNTIKLDRTTQVGPYTMVPSTGFNATAYDLEMSFSLQQTLTYLGGILTTTTTNPGYTEAIAMFQEYRIDEVEVMILYSNNVSQVNNTLNLPVLQIGIDYTGVGAITSAALLQFENLKVIQLGNYRGDAGPVFRFKPTCFMNGGTATIKPQNEWTSVLAPTIPHFALKMVMDPINSSSATSVGNLEFYVRYHLSLRKSN